MTELIVNIATRKEFTIDVKRAGENAQACPQCSFERKKKTAKSFSYNANSGVGYCQNCNSKFVKKQEAPVIKRKEYVRPVWTNNTSLPDKVVQWFKSRGISQQTLIRAKVGYAPEWMPQTQKQQNCICFQYFRDGELINTKFRDGAKNFKMVKDAELIFYNLDAIKGQKEVIITEGEMDCLSYMEAGIENVISVPNGAAKGSLKMEFLDNCWEYFESVEKVYLATDDDEAGRILQEELARRIGKEKCYQVNFFGHKDANELLQKDRLKLTETIQKSNEYPIEGVYTAKDFEGKIWDLKRNGLKPACHTSMEDLNKWITFQQGYVTLITGVPSHGKSEMTDMIVVDLNIIHGWKTAYFSPENWPLELHHSKIASKLTGADFSTEPDENTISAIHYCAENFFMIYPEKDFSLESILEKATQLVKKHGIKGLVIDAWNKLEHLYSGNESQYISKELDKLDSFAKMYGVHVFLVAHPTKMRKEDDGINYVVPDGYSIAGSAAFYSKPANIICVYRRYFQDGSNTTEIYIQKVKFRHWGEGRGMVQVVYNPVNGRYYCRFPDNRNYLKPPQAQIEFTPEPTITPNLKFTEKPNSNELTFFDDDQNMPQHEPEDSVPF